jgi:hypothetical protein
MRKILRPLRYFECRRGYVSNVGKTLSNKEDASSNVHEHEQTSSNDYSPEINKDN